MLNKVLILLLILPLIIGCRKKEKNEPVETESKFDPNLYGVWKKIGNDTFTEYLAFSDTIIYAAESLFVLRIDNKTGLKTKEIHGIKGDSKHYHYQISWSTHNFYYSIYMDTMNLTYFGNTMKYVRNKDLSINENTFIKRAIIEKSIVFYSLESWNHAGFAIDNDYIYPSYNPYIFKVDIMNSKVVDSFDLNIRWYCGFQNNGKFIFATLCSYSADTNKLYTSNGYNGPLNLLYDLKNIYIKNISYDKVKDVYYLYDAINMLYTFKNGVLTPFFDPEDNYFSNIVFLRGNEFLVTGIGTLFKIKIENGKCYYLESYEAIPGYSTTRDKYISEISIDDNNIWISTENDAKHEYEMEFFKIRIE